MRWHHKKPWRSSNALLLLLFFFLNFNRTFGVKILLPLSLSSGHSGKNSFAVERFLWGKWSQKCWNEDDTWSTDSLSSFCCRGESGGAGGEGSVCLWQPGGVSAGHRQQPGAADAQTYPLISKASKTFTVPLTALEMSLHHLFTSWNDRPPGAVGEPASLQEVTPSSQEANRK